MEELAEKDPEFYNYLKNDEADVFDFSESDNEIDDEEDKDDLIENDELIEDEDEDDEDDEDDENDMFDNTEHESDLNNEEGLLFKKINLFYYIILFFLGNEVIDGEFIEDNDDDDNNEKEEAELSESELSKNGELSKIKIRRDPNTNKKIVDKNLINYLSNILYDSIGQRSTLVECVKISIDCFIACLERVGGSGGGGSSTKQSRKKIKNLKDKKKISINSDFIVNSDDIFFEVLNLCFNTLGRCLLILLNPLEKVII